MLKYLKQIDDILSILLLLAIVIITFLQILFRFVLNLPLDWTEEVLRFIFVLFVYLSASIAIRDNTMIKIELIDLLITQSVKNILDLVLNIISMGFALIMVYYTIYIVRQSLFVGMLSPAIEFPMWIIYTILLLLFVLISIRYFQKVIHNLQKIINHK